MSARAPLDVDLEDKLLYGLTPTRLGYVVVGLLVAFALWGSHWAPAPLRALASSVEIGFAAAAAWGHWRGRPVDGWAVDAVRFLAANRRVSWHPRVARLLRFHPSGHRKRWRRLSEEISSFI
jgi:hypothetical protein